MVLLLALAASCNAGSPPAPTPTVWEGGDKIYLFGTSGAGQEVNLGIPPRPLIAEPAKGYFSPGPNATRIFGANIVGPTDPDLGLVRAEVSGETCITIISDQSVDYGDDEGFALSVNVDLVDKVFRFPAAEPKVSKLLESFQGGATYTESCDAPDPPVANDDEFPTPVPQGTTAVDITTVLSNDSDADGGTLSITDVQIYNPGGTQAAVGRIENLTATGFRFVPNPSFVGDAVIAYAITDGQYRMFSPWTPTSNNRFNMESKVTIHVVAVPHAPTAEDITLPTNFNTPLTIDITGYVADVDGDPVTLTSVSPPDNGAVDWDAGGTQIVYTPPQGYFGPANFTYTVSDGTASAPATADVLIQVQPSDSNNQQPIVTAPTSGQVIEIADTDGAAGEAVTINGTANDPEGSALTWTWVVDGGEPISAGNTLQTSLTDGTHALSVFVFDGELQSQTVSFTVNVTPPVANRPPIATLAIGGGTTNISDTDQAAGESVDLVASASDPDGTINATSFRWTVNSTAVAALNGQASVTITLPDGDSTVSVTVADNSGATATASISVSVSAPIPTLESVAANPTQAAVGRSVDVLCPMLNANAGTLTNDSPDLLAQCARILSNYENPDQQRQALQALSGEELQAAQTASINFGKVQSSNIAARLQALRAGARGVSLSGLNLSYEGEAVPLSAIGQAAKALGLVGGRCDNGGVADQRLGIFLNGKIGFGEKDTTENETGYDYDSIGATLGMDYRFTDSFIAGLALGYSEAKADFVADQGNLDSNGLSGNLFGSWYQGRAYLDLLAGYGQVDYDSLRHITYQVGNEVIDREATGSTDGTMTTAGLSFGYDVGRKGWTITPNASISYMKVEIDGFTESGSQGLDLEYGEQSADSMQYQAGLQAGYRFSQTWGVITPQVYGSYVVDKQEIGGIFLRFANDPFSGSPSQPGSSTVFFVTGDEPDEEYFRWGVSISAVFKNMVSAFINYESYAGMDTISYSEVTVGVRMQTSF
jgi:uncharacterized protein YhjY with autotransporter beta-barrel domain